MAGTGAGPGLREAGEQPVDVPVICVITRFGLRSAWYLLPTYLDFRRVVRQARRSATPGLLRAAFLVENPRTCYSLSVWTELNAIPRFGGTVHSHVDAARRVIGRVAFTPGRGPELWSTKWRLAAVSNNLNWSEFDLRGVIESIAYADARPG
jgi:hypothetical protein